MSLPPPHLPCRRASAEDVSRAIDGLAVPVTSLSAPVQADLEGQEEGIYVLVHTVEPTGMVFPACVWKVCCVPCGVDGGVSLGQC